MLTVKNFFDRPDIENIDAVLIRNVKYLRTFTIDEFKPLYNIDKVRVVLNEKRFLVFQFLNCSGYVAERGVPKEPQISLVTDALGNLFYLFHEKGYSNDELMFFKSDYKKPKQSAPKPSAQRSFGYTSDYQQYQDYVNESYYDAFEGDPDAYMNID